jgi:hypothetical protein
MQGVIRWHNLDAHYWYDATLPEAPPTPAELGSKLSVSATGILPDSVILTTSYVHVQYLIKTAA